MRTLGRICLAITVLAILAAAWTPYLWPSLATAALFLFAGASILGNADKRDRALNPDPDVWRIERSPIGPLTARDGEEVVQLTEGETAPWVDPDLAPLNTNPWQYPHKDDKPNRPTYGLPRKDKR